MAQINASGEAPDLSKTIASWAIGVVSILILLVVAVLLLMPREETPSQLDLSALPLVNATLNGTSAVLLAAGYMLIRRRQIKQHRVCMLSAFLLSTLFLISYVVYHTYAGSTSFAGQGWIRPVYFTILISHITLAAVVVPLALTTLLRTWQNTFDRHRRIARWTLPIWLYVSITGVVIYVMLYHWH
jgi:putative membrane protein